MILSISVTPPSAVNQISQFNPTKWTYGVGMSVHRSRHDNRVLRYTSNENWCKCVTIRNETPLYRTENLNQIDHFIHFYQRNPQNSVISVRQKITLMRFFYKSFQGNGIEKKGG